MTQTGGDLTGRGVILGQVVACLNLCPPPMCPKSPPNLRLSVVNEAPSRMQYLREDGDRSSGLERSDEIMEPVLMQGIASFVVLSEVGA